jgi:hypothetical protein
MTQYVFGSGSLILTPVQDASGAIISNGTPVKLLDHQECSIDMGGDIKKLFGQGGYPIAAGVGKRDVSVKCKGARVHSMIWNTLFFGQSLAAGLIAICTDSVAIAASVTVTPPSSGAFSADMGVVDWNGNPMKRVATGPATGQYAVSATGVYSFAAADIAAGRLVYPHYSYTAAVAGAQKMTVMNLPMGYAPIFRATLCVAYNGKIMYLDFPSCTANKMGISLKNEDFMIPEFEFTPTDNGTGNIFTMSLSE